MAVGLGDVTQESVLRAVAECTRLGRRKFLRQYGFGTARRYVLVHDGQSYDSKAILGVAHGFATGEFWRSDDRTGGLASAVSTLRRLGFDARDLGDPPKPPSDSIYGEVPGYPPGSPFANRREAQVARVHRQGQAGICGTRAFGAESIIVSGGYKDDEDFGGEIVYTGHGGRDGAGNQVRDQTFDDPGNAALLTSQLSGQPVRVIRGAHSSSKFAPATGLQYDGLFRVTDSWLDRGSDGHKICRYRLEAFEYGEAVPKAVVQADIAIPTGNLAPGRRSSIVQRIIRSTTVSNRVKKLHDDTCQACGIRLEIAGHGYSEGAHIRPLGHGHGGPDVIANVLCLCPNCHTLFDGGSLYIDEDFTVWLYGERQDKLRVDERHHIDPEQLAYHRFHYANVGQL